MSDLRSTGLDETRSAYDEILALRARVTELETALKEAEEKIAEFVWDRAGTAERAAIEKLNGTRD